MKQFLMVLGVAMLITGCTKKRPDGKYINYAQSDYSVAWTTLEIRKAGRSAGNLYEVHKTVVFQRKLPGGKLGRPEQKEDILSGRWDENDHSLRTNYVEPFVLDDTGDTLSIGGVRYILVPGR
jgi:hypothetical protein